MAFVGMMEISPLEAGLPALDDKNWHGHFVGFETKNYHFGISAQGEVVFRMLGKSGEPIGQKLAVPVQILVEENMPSGKVVAKTILPDSLESAQPATKKPKNIVIHGKVTGDAKFEVTVNEDRGVISFGGRLLDAGTLKNPLKFSLRLKFGDAYPSEKAGGGKNDRKKLEDKSRDDRLILTYSDGKRVKLSTTEKADASASEANGMGIAAAEVEFSSYQGNKFLANSSAPIAMKISNSSANAFQNGFTLTWEADPVKDPQAKARLNIEVK